MPRRHRLVNASQIEQHEAHYSCSPACPTRERLRRLYNVATLDLDSETLTNGRQLSLAKQMVNGPGLRFVISKMVTALAKAVRTGNTQDYPNLHAALGADRSRAIGLALGGIADFCFNLEYARRLKPQKWVYCDACASPQMFYPYLGVCPYCIVNGTEIWEASIGRAQPGENSEEDENESESRYFGNKIQSHHVGRIGERIIVYILDLLSKCADENARTLLVTDDQHDVDALFFVFGKGVITQIKASPLILLPLVADTSSQASRHQFSNLDIRATPLSFYIPWTGQKIDLGPFSSDTWPHDVMLTGDRERDFLKIIDNWIDIYSGFEVPKIQRSGFQIKKAHLTAGWGSPIDDNKAKAGLARSDNMMKGTYASIKYGAYYGRECIDGALRSALVANIDPAHQYADYLEKLHDIQWFHRTDAEVRDTDGALVIPRSKTVNLFDAIFTFNRQIINDPDISAAWSMSTFTDKLSTCDLTDFLQRWGAPGNHA